MNKFDHDDFTLRLIQYMDGNVSRAEKEYIERTLEERQDARDLWHDVLTTFAMDLSPIIAPKKVRRTTVVHKIKSFLASTYLNRTLIAGSIALCLANISFMLTFKKSAERPARELSLPAPEAHHGPRISLGAEGEISSDSGYTQIVLKKGLADNKWTNVDVPRACTFKIKLSDGTKVQLNADSKLRFPADFPNASRELYLEGEAYIEATSIIGKPLVVHTPQGDVIAVSSGIFYVETFNSQLRVSVLSGEAFIRTSQKVVGLLKGNAMTVTGDEKFEKFNITTFDERVITSRLEGRYVIYSQKLSDICNLLERVYAVSIVLDHADIGKITYSGMILAKEPLEVFLHNVAAVGRLEYYVDKNGVWHLR
jgi:hypothetical protein